MDDRVRLSITLLSSWIRRFIVGLIHVKYALPLSSIRGQRAAVLSMRCVSDLRGVQTGLHVNRMLCFYPQSDVHIIFYWVSEVLLTQTNNCEWLRQAVQMLFINVEWHISMVQFFALKWEKYTRKSIKKQSPWLLRFTHPWYFEKLNLGWQKVYTCKLSLYFPYKRPSQLACRNLNYHLNVSSNK